jgi:hypothetical protein
MKMHEAVFFCPEIYKNPFVAHLTLKMLLLSTLTINLSYEQKILYSLQ